MNFLPRIEEMLLLAIWKLESNAHPTELTGRPRVYYTLTPHGLQKLAAIQKVNNSLWLGVPDLEESTKN